MRKLSLAGKISVVKFLVIPKFVYLFSNISNPPKKFFDELQSKLFRFIWSNKKDRIKRRLSVLYNELADGGLNMIHVESFCRALKIAWVKRVLDKENKGNWKTMFCLNTKEIGGEYIFMCNFKANDMNIKINNFWRDVLFS